MIDLKLGGLFIDKDEYQFILGKPCKRKARDVGTQEVREVDAFDAMGYFPTLGNALHGAYRVLQREMVGSKLMTLSEAIQASEAIEQRLLAVGEAERLKEV